MTSVFIFTIFPHPISNAKACRMKMKAILVMLLVAPHLAIAGWFGPDNYDECIVDKMKGQEKSMMSRVVSACRSKFPQPYSIAEYAGWSDKSSKEILIDWLGEEVKVVKNDSPYTVTEVILKFSKKDCDELTKSSQPDPFTFYDSPNFSFKIAGSVGRAEQGFNPAIYKCARLYDVLGLKNE